MKSVGKVTRIDFLSRRPGPCCSNATSLTPTFLSLQASADELSNADDVSGSLQAIYVLMPVLTVVTIIAMLIYAAIHNLFSSSEKLNRASKRKSNSTTGIRPVKSAEGKYVLVTGAYLYVTS